MRGEGADSKGGVRFVHSLHRADGYLSKCASVLFLESRGPHSPCTLRMSVHSFVFWMQNAVPGKITLPAAGSEQRQLRAGERPSEVPGVTSEDGKEAGCGWDTLQRAGGLCCSDAAWGGGLLPSEPVCYSQRKAQFCRNQINVPCNCTSFLVKLKT